MALVSPGRSFTRAAARGSQVGFARRGGQVLPCGRAAGRSAYGAQAGRGLAALLLVAAAGRGAHAATARLSSPKSDARRLAASILKSDGVRLGLAVHVGGDGRLAAELARGGMRHVQCLARDGAAAEVARTHIQDQKLYGRAIADHHPLNEMPYADNLLNLLIVDDVPGLEKKGNSVAEMLRVVCPGGVAYLGGADTRKVRSALSGARSVKKSGAYVRVVKPRPAEMDEWAHFRHDAARDATSADALVGPPRGLRWIADMYWARWTIRQAVTANGRIFYMIPNEVKRLGESEGYRIVARDAFNGLKLWERRFEGKIRYGVSGIAADSERVYLWLIGPAIALDAATGETAMKYEFSTSMVTPYKGMLIAGQGARRAYDSRTGKKLWDGDGRGYDPVVIYDDKIYVASKTNIVCCSTGTGKKIWEAPLSASGKGSLLGCRDGVLLFKGGGRKDGTTSAYSAADGRFLWSYGYTLSGHGGRQDSFLVGGLVWVHKGTPSKATYGESWIGLDPKTGEVRKEVKYADGQKVKHRCYRDRATYRYIMCGGMDFFEVESGRHFAFHGSRGGCGFGYLPANGLTYSFPTLCECFAHIRGYSALSARPVPGPAELSAASASRYKRGRARASGFAPGADDWPTFRHDALRSGATSARVPADLRKKWDVKLSERVSAPVAAGGRVYVACIDENRVVCMDLRNGKTVWSFTAGGRVDTPPTITSGLAIFGSRDGCVYAVSASRGEMAWRMRAAPVDRRIVERGQVESKWPVHGTVLESGGTIYFSAGRHSELDGGIWLYAADPRSGRVKWQRRIVRENPFQQTTRGSIRNEMNDILTTDGQTVYMNRTRYDAATGKPSAGTSNYMWGGTPGFIVDMTLPPYGWKHRNQKRRGWNDSKRDRRKVEGNILSVSGSSVYGLSNDDFEVFGGGKGGWKTKIPEGSSPKALCLAADKMFVPAMPDMNDPARGEVWVFETGGGKQVGKIPLPSAPAFEGVAAVPGTLLVCTQDGRVVCLGR